MSRWWRAEDSSIDHPKLLKLSDAMHRAWYTLMCIASANGGALPATDDIAVRLRMPIAKVAEWITKLVSAELFDNIDGVFVPHNWNKRQYKSDKADPTAAERMKRHRNKKRNAVTDATDRNDRNGGVSEIRPEAEAKPEADSEQSRADASAPIDEELKKRETGLRVGIGAHFASRGVPVPENMDRCLLWLTSGYAPGTVLKAVESVLKRGTKPSTLEYFDGAIKDAHAKAPAPAPLIDTMAGWFLIIEGTPEEICWQQHSRETTGRPMFICDQPYNCGTVRGAKKPTQWPPGYNDFGERVTHETDDGSEVAA